MIDLGESRADVLTFLRGLFAGLDDQTERIEVRVLHKRKVKRWMCRNAEEAVGAVEEHGQPEENIYFGVLPRKRGVPTGRREDVTRGVAAWIDLDADIPAAEARARVDKYPVKPSYVIKSGHGYHVYWLLNESVPPSELHSLEALNKAIAELVGADAACHDAARILRMPGTMNTKHDEPRPCAFVGKPSAKPRRCSLAELVEACPSICASGAAQGQRGVSDAAHLSETAPSICASGAAQGQRGVSGANGWNGVAEGGRNNQLFRKACDLRERRVPEDLALGALKEWNQRNKPPLPDEEVTDTVTRVYRGGLIGGVAAEARSEDDGPLCYSVKDLTAMAVPEVDFAVGGLVPANGVTIFSGEGGIGKSFIALDLAIAVASGGRFAESFACRQGPVFYVDLENDESTIGRRLKQLARGRGIDPTDLDIHFPMRGMPGVELQQDTPEGRAWLWSAVRKYRPRLVVIDSLIACHSGDENNNVMMRQLMSGLDGLARAGEMGLVVVHHQRKRGTNNDAGQLMRGASDLRNAVVSHFAAQRMKDDIVLFTHDKCRPAQPASPFSLAIRDQKDGSARVELVAVGHAAEGTRNVQGEREAQVIEALRSLGPSTPQALYAVMAAGERTCQRTLFRLAKQGLIAKWDDGLYRLTENQPPVELRLLDGGKEDDDAADDQAQPIRIV